MSLFKTAARTAVASSVHGRIQRRQHERWAAADQARTVVPPHQPAPVPPVPPAAPVPQASPAAPSADDLITQLERLGRLRDGGVLTEEEFAAQKARLLA